MTTQTGATTGHAAHIEEAPSAPLDVTRLYQEGLIAGLVGAATVALWFLIIDVIQGRPLYTPTVLGAALFSRGAGLPSADAGPDLGMVLMFTWVHGLVFAALGGIAARLLAVAERNPGLGFGVVLFFVIFQCGFTTAMAFVAPAVFSVLGWASIFVANLLAAATMVVYFRLRHPNITVRP